MTDLTKFNFSKLNGSNYQTWKYRMELLLIKEDLWDVVLKEKPTEVTDAWKKQDGKARATIGLLIEDNQIMHIRNALTAKEVWDSLKSYYEKSTLTSKVFLLKRICNLKLLEGGNMEEHIGNMMELIYKLTSLGEELAEHLIVAFLLCSLPNSYNSLVTALESRPEKDITLEVVKEKYYKNTRGDKN